MILSDFLLRETVNLQCSTFGIDHALITQDKAHFLDYPHSVDYQFNSRGFRDEEWPESHKELQQAIWCVGDSFTVGIGSPYNHIWPNVLQQLTNQRVINVSLSGASNSWIARKIVRIANEIAPANIIALWSFFHRRESSDTSKSDEDRRIHQHNTSDEEDSDNFKSCVDNATSNLSSSNLLHFTIPSAHLRYDLVLSWNNIRDKEWPTLPPKTLLEFDSLPEFIKLEINQKFNLTGPFRLLLQKNELFAVYKNQKNIIEIPRLDLARDAQHFGYATSSWLADSIIPRLTI